MPRLISPHALGVRLEEDARPVLVDVRTMAASNGWPRRPGERGGRLPGAVPFPASWLDDPSADEIRARLDRAGVTGGQELVVYGEGSDDGAAAAGRLVGLGFEPGAILEGGVEAWRADPARPLERLERWRHLVPCSWLAGVLKGAEVPAPPGARVVVLHVAFRNREDYEGGHVPGAVFLDTLELEEEERWNRRTPAEIEGALLAHGIDRDTTVVVTGRTGSPDMSQAEPGREAGQIAANRVAALLLYAGVDDVRVLEGGLGAWEKAGLPLSTDEVEPSTVDGFGCEVPARPGVMIDIARVKELLADPDGAVVSVRSWAEYIGEVSGYHYVKPMGRIPGAVFGNCGSDAYHMQNYRNHDNTMRDWKVIAANWAEVGVVPSKSVAFYCGTGWRASEAYMCAWLMGWPDVAVYDGGWFDWSIDEENPLERGIPAEVPAIFS